MPIILLGNKRRQFKHLYILQRRRLARRNDPLSAYQHEHHRNALLYLQEILKQSWSVLLLERRFMYSIQSYTEYLSKSDVIDKLLASLQSYEDCLSHQAAKPDDVRYDMTEFERKLSVALLEVHSMGSKSMLLGPVDRPKAGWQCMRECQTWEANRVHLRDPEKRKIRAQEWVVPELGELMDGVMTVTSFDEDGEESGDAPLVGTLPGSLKKICALAEEKTTEAKDQQTSSRVPQSTKLRLKTESEFEAAIVKLEQISEADTAKSVEVEEHPPVRLVLRRPLMLKAKEE